MKPLDRFQIKKKVLIAHTQTDTPIKLELNGNINNQQVRWKNTSSRVSEKAPPRHGSIQKIHRRWRTSPVEGEHVRHQRPPAQTKSEQMMSETTKLRRRRRITEMESETPVWSNLDTA
jgi:glutamate synthase domain-containing protein 1